MVLAWGLPGRIRPRLDDPLRVCYSFYISLLNRLLVLFLDSERGLWDVVPDTAPLARLHTSQGSTISIQRKPHSAAMSCPARDIGPGPGLGARPAESPPGADRISYKVFYSFRRTLDAVIEVE